MIVDRKDDMLADFFIHERIAEWRHIRDDVVVGIRFSRSENRVGFVFVRFVVVQRRRR